MTYGHWFSPPVRLGLAGPVFLDSVRLQAYTDTMRERINFYVDLPDLRKLEELRKETGASIAELIRRAIHEFVKKRTAQTGEERGRGSGSSRS